MYRATLPEFCCAGDCCKASYCFCRSSRCFVAIFKLYKAASFSDRIGAIAFAISSSGAGAEKCFSFALKSSASCVFSSSRVWTGATASFTAFAVASIDGKRGGNSERATPKPALSPKMSHSHQSWRRGFHPESNLRPHSGVEFHTLRNKESQPFSLANRRTFALRSPEQMPRNMKLAIAIAAVRTVKSVGVIA